MKRSAFSDFRFERVENEEAAKFLLAKRNVEHYWEMAARATPENVVVEL